VTPLLLAVSQAKATVVRAGQPQLDSHAEP
jgi:hypothetical protein